MKTCNETSCVATVDTGKIGDILGRIYSFNESLKLYHWHDTGAGSYARHMATDQALDGLRSILDRLVETSYALYGDLSIVIPETAVPQQICEHVDRMYCYMGQAGEAFAETFSKSIVDEYMEALQQLGYRIKRLG